MASNGPPRVAFTSGAVKMIYNYSNGTPRLINLIADRCLTAGLSYRQEKQRPDCKGRLYRSELPKREMDGAGSSGHCAGEPVALFITLLWGGYGNPSALVESAVTHRLAMACFETGACRVR